MWRSSSVPITQKDLLSFRSGGSSNERSHGLAGVGVSPKIGRISIEKRSHFCASLQSDSCSASYATQHDLSGQTLSPFHYSVRKASLCQRSDVRRKPPPGARHCRCCNVNMVCL